MSNEFNNKNNHVLKFKKTAPDTSPLAVKWRYILLRSHVPIHRPSQIYPLQPRQLLQLPQIPQLILLPSSHPQIHLQIVWLWMFCWAFWTKSLGLSPLPWTMRTLNNPVGNYLKWHFRNGSEPKMIKKLATLNTWSWLNAPKGSLINVRNQNRCIN